MYTNSGAPPSPGELLYSLLRRARFKPLPRRTQAVDSSVIRHSFASAAADFVARPNNRTLGPRDGALAQEESLKPEHGRHHARGMSLSPQFALGAKFTTPVSAGSMLIYRRLRGRRSGTAIAAGMLEHPSSLTKCLGSVRRDDGPVAFWFDSS
jgi:hypothetical protein